MIQATNNNRVERIYKWRHLYTNENKCTGNNNTGNIGKKNGYPGIYMEPQQAHNHRKYDNNGKGWYFRFDDDDTMSYNYII